MSPKQYLESLQDVLYTACLEEDLTLDPKLERMLQMQESMIPHKSTARSSWQLHSLVYPDLSETVS